MPSEAGTTAVTRRVSKREDCTQKETYTREKRPTHVKRDILLYTESTRMNRSRDLYISKETYVYQKRPIHMERNM